MAKAPSEKSWKMHLFEGFLLLACTGFLFWYFTDFENSHDSSRSINWVVAWLYNLGGKWLVCLLTLALAIAEFATAHRKRLQQT